MRLIGVAMVKNEIDVIEYFVRHNLQFLDGLLIIDNGSVDGTREVLSRLMSDEQLPIAIYDDPEMGYFQSEKTTKIVFTADRYFQPDFTFILDADEFIVATSRQDLEASLANLPPKTAGRIKWQTYVVLEDQQGVGDNLFSRIQHRRINENPQYHKVVVPKDFGEHADSIVAQGNHYISNKRFQIPHQVIPELLVAHFPVRSIRQLKLKILLGWLGYLAKKPKNQEGYHWKQIYDLILAHQLTTDTLRKISKNYAQQSNILADFSLNELAIDPLRSDVQIRYQRFLEQEEVFTVIKSIEKNFLQPTLLPEEKTKQLHIDWPPFQFLCEKYRPQSVLGVNCNKGEYVQLLKNAGVQFSFGVGLKPYDDSMLCERESYFFYDKLVSLSSDNQFDMILFTEQVQSFDKEVQEKVVRFMTDCSAKRIVFSCDAREKRTTRRGNGLELEFWITFFDTLGWKANIFDSLVCRTMASLPWLKNGLTVFEKSPQSNKSGGFTIQHLLDSKAGKASWSRPAPNFYTYPLSKE